MNSAVLFSGGGVCDLGFPSPPKAVVDCDSWFLEAYRMNHPATTERVQSNLTTEPTESVIERMNCGRLDLLWASPPCPGFSRGRFIARQGGSTEKPRHALLRGLYLRPVDFAKVLRPRFVVCENVAGILTLAPGPRFLRWLRDDLKALGYATDVWRLQAADFWEPQFRDRVFVVGALNGKIPPPPVGGGKPKTLRDAIGHLSESQALADGCSPMSDQLRQNISKVKPGGFLAADRKKGHRKRLEWDKPCHALMTSPAVMKSPDAVHPEKNRFLSVREYACLFGVPDYRFPELMPMAKRYEVIGQSIQPALSRAVIDHLTNR